MFLIISEIYLFLFRTHVKLIECWAVRDDQQHPATDDLRASLLSRRQPT